ncbi:MAG: hypothetical protein IJ435_01640, partial [Clostridia bacterium]|nr:hypothetical protein [Clostridia bacterium]
PMFYGDILGDWREEFIMTSGDYSRLVIFSTTIPTDYRLDCLAQNPCYRNGMTGKGYYQSHMLDYFLGHNMDFPNEDETGDVTYSTAGFVSTSHGPVTDGVIEMDITPLAVADNVIGVTSSTSNPTWYDQFNIVINLGADGYIRAYNGSSGLSSYETVSYEAEKKYHLYIETNVSEKAYSAWITDEDGNKYTLAIDYAYRASASEASDMGKLTLIGGYGVGGSLFTASNIMFYNALSKQITYILNDSNGNEVLRWTDTRAFEPGETAYNFPAGESYAEINNKAYILKSATDQVYTVTDDNNDTHTVTLEIVHENAVRTDTFADTDGNNNDEAAEMLFVGSQGVSDASDTDDDNNATVTGSGYNMGAPRIPLLTFDVPDDYENGKAVKLNVYVARAHTHLGGGNSMKLAANSVNVTVDESLGYDADGIASFSNMVWSDGMFRLAPNTETVGEWLSIDVTEFVESATDKVTFTLYAPRAAVYIPDRESASAGGSYMGKAAYLEVVDGETITTTGMEKVTKNGSLVQNKASFVVPANSTVKFYAPADSGAYAVTNGSDVYTLTDNVTAAVNPAEGSYYLTYRSEDAIYSTAGTNEGFTQTNHGPITSGTIDMDLTPFALADNVVGITSSTSSPAWYSDLNLIINFTANGTIQAYNSGAYASESTIAYQANKKYHLHIETAVSTGTYDAWITDEEGNEYTLATDYAYRSTAPSASDLGKLTLIGGWNVEAGLLMAENVVFETAFEKTITYTISNSDGVYDTWTEKNWYEAGDVLYDFPAGEFYYERGGEAYILKSETAQKYTAADDSVTTLNVSFTLVHENAVLKDTFADVNGSVNDESGDMLFVGSNGISVVPDKDADDNATHNGSYYVGNPRVPMLMFNKPQLETDEAVKLHVYVAEINGNLGVDKWMKLAANVSDVTVDEAMGYAAADVADTEGIVWSDNTVTQSSDETRDNVYSAGSWAMIDVTEFIKNATGDTVTFTLYAPMSAAYVVDRENAMMDGSYMGKAAYLEVVDAETIETSGALKVTKNGTALKNNESFVVTDTDSIRFYSADESIVAFTDGTRVYKVEVAVNCEAGSYSAATLGVSAIDGAQVRIGDGVDDTGKITGTGSGLRFITEINKTESLAAVTGATFGVRITAEGSDAAVNIPAEKWQTGDVFTSALTNLAETNYNRKFTATPYVIADGQTFYGTPVTRSIYQVAAGLLVEGSADGTEYDDEAIGSDILYKVLNAYVNQTGIRLSVTSEGLTAYTGTGTSAYSGEQFFEVVSAEEVSENVYTITIKPLGEKTVIAPYWQEYIRINNNNSKIKSFTSLTENADGSVTITFDYAAYLNQ